MRGYLRVGVQYADAAGLHHLVYGVSLDPVQVAVVFAVFQIASIFYIGFHLAAAGEGVHPTLVFPLFGLPGGIWERGVMNTHTAAADSDLRPAEL